MTAPLPFVRRYSGAAKVLIRYLPDKQQYAFAISVGGKQVNACSVGAIATMPEWERSSDEGYDEAARGALSFTAFELSENSDMRENRSGMDHEDFANVLARDENSYEILVSRDPGSRHRRQGRYAE